MINRSSLSLHINMMQISQWEKRRIQSNILFTRRDLRARLELAVDHMLDACSQVECVSTTTGASTDDEPEFLMKSPRVTTIARKQLATAVRDLMQHGLIQASKQAHFVLTHSHPTWALPLGYHDGRQGNAQRVKLFFLHNYRYFSKSLKFHLLEYTPS